jgi:uncharacterized alkaline shock family protein YloU
MAEALVFEGLTVSPTVIETIVRIAAEKVEGVSAVGTGPVTGAAALLKAKTSGIELASGPDGALEITVHMSAVYGQKLQELGSAVQGAVADALRVQLGVTVCRVDICIDALAFPA